ncbi:GbsR/MarR family transcriptional regulator [Luteolibacter marinus]|uniref:GbsR/MarR family transcriptional regulator n=1 Tax=Luteolibacter marinus TaxID=2776705 RepID=UPI001866D05A|nr:MarR family transcriptional regulator [Luteolibacter marinus]
MPPVREEDEIREFPALGPLEAQVIHVFVDGMKVLGLPRSIGEIYGMLFISPEPLSLDDLVERLGISKGSASQGLRALKGLGAVRETSLENSRRCHYEADTELKRLVGGFIREQVRPHLESGQSKIGKLTESAEGEDDPERREFYLNRVKQLEHWMQKGRFVLPLLQKVLGE